MRPDELAASQIIEFDRGESFGKAQFTLSPEAYEFAVTDKGWNLRGKAYQVKDAVRLLREVKKAQRLKSLRENWCAVPAGLAHFALPPRAALGYAGPLLRS